MFCLSHRKKAHKLPKNNFVSCDSHIFYSFYSKLKISSTLLLLAVQHIADVLSSRSTYDAVKLSKVFNGVCYPANNAGVSPMLCFQ